MRHLYAFLTLMMLSLSACTADDPHPSGDVVINTQDQALLGDYCAAHPVACQVWCDNHPIACHVLCLVRPNLPVCDDGPMCVDLGDPCVDEEDPNFVPCCGDADCFFDEEEGYTCQSNVPACEGPQLNQECDPEGEPCCPSTNPNDPPVTCEATDPSDPNTSYVCTPG